MRSAATPLHSVSIKCQIVVRWKLDYTEARTSPTFSHPCLLLAKRRVADSDGHSKHQLTTKEFVVRFEPWSTRLIPDHHRLFYTAVRDQQ